MPETPARAAIYLQVSTEGQAEKGHEPPKPE
jgi:hypothetical protein